MLKFEEGLEPSSSFWMVALQTKCQELAEPKNLHETTDRKIKKRTREVRIDGYAYRAQLEQAACEFSIITSQGHFVNLSDFRPDFNLLFEQQVKSL